MEDWRNVWRNGIAPLMSRAGLESLRGALKADDPRLIQGSTTTPPPLMCVQDWPVECACAIAFCGWQGDGLTTVGQVEEYLHSLMLLTDARMGEPAAIRWFLNWFDETPRYQMLHELLPEVELALANRPMDATDAREMAEATL
jgi:hypothetical protein